jgi:hypothetical protein
MTKRNDKKNAARIITLLFRYGAASIDRLASELKLDWMTVAWLLANPLSDRATPTAAGLWVLR